MATGNPKTKWNGYVLQDVPSNAQSGITLNYKDKSPISEIFATRPLDMTLLWANSTDATNCLYYGDNLPILASLIRNPSVQGKVKLIYIDPPFATNSVFHSRTQTDAYQDVLVGHSYIEFIRKRLILLRELLADDGSIYVHLDDHMACYVKVLMDEVFGSQNFRNWITRRKCSHKNFTHKQYGNISDYILFYTKTDRYIWQRPFEKWTEERARKEYPYIEEATGRRYKKVPIHAPGTRQGETGQPWRGKLPPPGKHWQYPPRVLDDMDACGAIYWSPTGNPRRKIYFDESEGVPVQDMWYDFRDTSNQNVHITGYPTEKNPLLLERIIRASSRSGDLVLDCFCGSGTTLAVAEHLGRDWIGIDNSVEAITTTIQRFVNGTERMGDFVMPKNNCQVPQEQLALFPKPEPTTNKPHTSKNFRLYVPDGIERTMANYVEEWLQLLVE